MKTYDQKLRQIREEVREVESNNRWLQCAFFTMVKVLEKKKIVTKSEIPRMMMKNIEDNPFTEKKAVRELKAPKRVGVKQKKK